MNKQVEQIRAEIERRLSVMAKSAWGTDELKRLLSFIDSLQEEPVNEKKCMFTKDIYTDEDRKVLCEDCKERCEYSKKEEPVSEDLEEELDRYLPSVFSKDMDGGNPRFTTWFKALRKTALHFTIWQKQQIMKDAVDAFIYKGGIRLKEWPLPEKCGEHLDSVKVIIIKED